MERTATGWYAWSWASEGAGEVRLHVRDKAGNEAEATMTLPLRTKESPAVLTVSPAVVRMAPLDEGEEVVRRVVLRGSRPFCITRVEGASPLRVVSKDSDRSEDTHVVTIKVKGPASREWVLRFHTDLGSTVEPAEVRVCAGETP